LANIPAASLQGVDLAQIHAVNPVAAVEIERLGLKMESGHESDEEFERLCQLLFDVGAHIKSQRLLLANAREGDRLHSLYKKLFGTDAEVKFHSAVRAFEEQFLVDLVRLRSDRYLSVVYRCIDKGQIGTLRPQLPELSRNAHEVAITQEDNGVIVADVYPAQPSEAKEFVESTPLVFDNALWMYDEAV
jgi:hypothetical protein